MSPSSQVRAKSPGGALAVGLHRYAFHVPSLITALDDPSGPAPLRPKLALDRADGSVRVAIEVSDLTSCPRMRAAALSVAVPPGSDPPKMLTSADEVEELSQLLVATDREPAFRQAAGCGRLSAAAMSSAKAQIARQLSGQPRRGQRIVVLVAENEITTMAVEFVKVSARAG
jgi:hypothetical protein